MGAQASTPPWIVIGILPPGGRWRSGPQDPWGRLPHIHPWCHHTHLGRDPSEPPLLPRIRPHGTMLSPSRPVVIIGSTQPPRLACFMWMSRSTSTRGTPVNLVMIHICGQLKDWPSCLGRPDREALTYSPRAGDGHRSLLRLDRQTSGSRCLRDFASWRTPNECHQFGGRRRRAPAASRPGRT